MKKIEIPSDMMKMAISLKSFGIDGCAWRARDALAVISYLSEQNAVILGGDVYKIIGNQIGTAYAGWHYDPITTKSARENIRASEEKAVAYIRHFFQRNGDDFIYAIVFQVFINDFCLETGY